MLLLLLLMALSSAGLKVPQLVELLLLRNVLTSFRKKTAAADDALANSSRMLPPIATAGKMVGRQRMINDYMVTTINDDKQN
jgi:hypothetical protein